MGTHQLEIAEQGTSQDMKENDRATGTHFLEIAEREMGQDTERK